VGGVRTRRIVSRRPASTLYEGRLEDPRGGITGAPTGVIVWKPGTVVDDWDRAAIRERMERARAVDHPAWAAVVHGSLQGDAPSLSFAWTDGMRELRSFVAEDGPLPARETVSLGIAIAAALEALHEADVAHGAVDPWHVFVGSAVSAGRRVSARPQSFDESGDAAAAGSARLVGLGLTRAECLSASAGDVADAMLGHLAPERTNGEAPTPASDLYGLGATLFFAATAVPPFEPPSRGASAGRAPSPGDTPGEASARDALLRDIRSGSRPLLDRGRPDVPRALARVVSACLAIDPSSRPSSAADVRRALEAVPKGSPWTISKFRGDVAPTGEPEERGPAEGDRT